MEGERSRASSAPGTATGRADVGAGDGVPARRRHGERRARSARLRPERVDSSTSSRSESRASSGARTGRRRAVAAPIIVDRSLWGVISVSRTDGRAVPGRGRGPARRLRGARRPGDRERRRAGGGPRLAGAARGGRRRRAQEARAQPPRRRAAATRRRSRSPCASRTRRLESRRRTPATLIAGASPSELSHALDELRELARGIHPAVLTDRGLAPALGALAERAPLPVTIESDLAEPAPVLGRGGRLLRRRRSR